MKKLTWVAALFVAFALALSLGACSDTVTEATTSATAEATTASATATTAAATPDATEPASAGGDSLPDRFNYEVEESDVTTGLSAGEILGDGECVLPGLSWGMDVEGLKEHFGVESLPGPAEYDPELWYIVETGGQELKGVPLFNFRDGSLSSMAVIISLGNEGKDMDGAAESIVRELTEALGEPESQSEDEEDGSVIAEYRWAAVGDTRTVLWVESGDEGVTKIQLNIALLSE